MTSSRKPTIILIHGFRGAPEGLSKIAAALRAAGYGVLTPAVPPFGGAEPLTAYTPDSYADWLAGFIKSRNLQKTSPLPILIGHSMGSLVVSSCAARYPELVNEKLILLSPISIRPNTFFRLITPLSAILPRKLIDYITTKFLYVPPQESTKSKTSFAATLFATHECSAACSAKKLHIFKSATFSANHSIDNFDLSKKSIRIIAGKEDRLVPAAATEALAKKLHARLTFLPDTGHLHNYEYPELTAKTIIRYLQ